MNLRFLGSDYRKALTGLVQKTSFRLTDYINFIGINRGDVDSLPSGYVEPLMITDPASPNFGKRKFVLGVDDVD